MSLDIFLHRFSKRYRSIDEMPESETLHPLGSLLEVQQAISAIFPGTDWNDPVWGIFFDAELGGIEFNIEQDDPVIDVALHVHGGTGTVPGILELCQRLDCQALEACGSTFLDQEEIPADDLEKWRRYRDRVAGDSTR